MIRQNAYGYENEIRQLLLKSLVNTNRHQVDSWMKYEFDPSQMFCYFDHDVLTSCLQIQRKSMNFLGQECRISVFSVAATLPDYRQRNHFGKLLEAALEQANHNDLLSLVYTSFPKLYESRSFQPVSLTKYYWISGHSITKGNDKHVKVYLEDIDLYPLYTEFMSYFDGSVILDKQDFLKKLKLAQECRKQVIVSFDASGKPNGFAIYKSFNNYAKVEVIQYLDTSAIFDLMRYISLRSKDISLIVSQDERLEKLFPNDMPRNQGTVLVRLNNYKLFSKWVNKDIRNAKQAFDLLEGPMWNHFID